MVSTITALAAVALLLAWHLHNRRHPAWTASADGRFYVTLGYPLVMVAIYWMVSAPTALAWEWALGNAWALVAMMSFVYGFGCLNRDQRRCQQAALSVETITAAPTAHRT
ncbi:hypothetical protein [Mycolicibacterium palauense]|uniref:hypothetical protein n=1 Tax=Mycolicibacterium palauense TaxID=2034511 RepID=UPI000BFEF7A6|nr:hypothetical protein [Mycolicibacterium palauense]